MKRVLVIAYHFPPLGTGGVGRALGWARHLPGLKWQPTILAATPHPGWPRDPTLLSQIPDSVRVARVPAWDPRPSAMRGLNHRELTFLWRPAALRVGRQMLAQQGVDLILSTAPPPVAHSVAATLAHEFSVPWIADFRDPWALRAPTFWRRMRRRQIVASAADVVAVNDRLQQHLSVSLNRSVHTVFNGYEPDEIPDARMRTPKRVVLLGTLSDFNQFQTLFKVLARLKGEFVHIGAARNFDLSGRAALADFHGACSKGYLSRANALTEAARGSVMALSLAREEHLTLPTKIFDYIGLGGPVLCLGNQGATAEFLQRIPGLGISVPADDEAAIESALRHLWSDPTIDLSGEQAKYTRAAQVRRLVDVMNAVVNRVN